MKQSTFLAGHGPRRDSSREEFWRGMLRAFAGSGQSVRAYCRAHDLSEPSFYAWRRTLARRDAAMSADPIGVAAAGRIHAAGPAGEEDLAPANRNAAPALLPVRLVGPACGRIEIRLVSGARLRLRPPVDAHALAAILAALDDDRARASRFGSGSSTSSPSRSAR